MTGGVSLAIWMGGVTRELNLLQHASWVREADDPDGADRALENLEGGNAKIARRYLRLLELLDVMVDVDMLSGTSAGGINAALFGLSRASGLDLGGLRKLWLKAGAFDTLLRDPRDDKPPSLLYGDQELLRNLVDGIGDLRNATIPNTRQTPETRVFITTTWLTPETSRFTDALGTLIQDSDHRGVFKFDQSKLADAACDGAVALAARSSASFPGAFEPSFVPFDADIPPAGRGQPEHPDMKDFANTTRAHWAADGGLLMNEPIRPLLREVFKRPAERQVRRVLLYVVPLTGDDPDPRTSPSVETIGDELTLSDALLKDLGAVLYQSIVAELKELTEHNDRVDALRDTRLRMAELGLRTGECRPVGSGLRKKCVFEKTRLTDTPIFLDYIKRQSRWLVRPVVAALMQEVTTMKKEDLPAHWREALATGNTAEQDCRAASATAVKDEWPKEAPALGNYDALGRFGLAPFDGAHATVLTMLRHAYELAIPGRPAPDIPSEDVFEYLTRIKRRLKDAFVRGPEPDVHRIVRDEIKGDKERELAQVAADASVEYAHALAKPARSPDSLAHGWKLLSDLVAECAKWLGELSKRGDHEVAPNATAVPGRDGRDQRMKDAGDELRTYLEFLGTDAPGIAVGLFDLHAATRAVLPAGAEEVEQPIDLVQVSADTRTVLAPKRATAGTKLTGGQFHHFGAFYKGSWRANDWMWGRLDGAGWLVHLLLDPRRVLAIADQQPRGTRADWFYNELRERLDLDEPAGEPMEPPPTTRFLTPEAVKDELRYLDNEDPIPKSLPLTALWVATGWQRDIAGTELRVVAEQVQVTDKNNSWARDVLQKPEPPTNSSAPGTDPIVGKLKTCPVPDETFGTDLTTPLFRRTATKAAAVTTAAVGATIKNPPGVVRSVLTTIRTVTLAGYRAVKATSGSTRLLFVAGVLALLAGVWGMLQDSVWFGLSGIVLVLLGAYLITIVAWRWKFLLYIGGVTVVVAAAAVVSPVGRENLFGESGNKADLGLVGEDVIPWLKGDWWHVLVVLVGVALLPAVVGMVLRLIRRPRRKPKPVPSTR